MSNYLITGGAGFIGSHLADHLLAAGHTVRVLDDLSTGKTANLPADVDLIVGDIRDAALVEKSMTGMDGCFHLAAIASVAASNERWHETHEINLGATIHVFEAARNLGKLPVVYASSAAVFGANDQTPLTETSAAQPLTAYGADKYGCELHAKTALVVHGVPTRGMRFFNVYGPRQDPASPYSGVISIFADRLARGQDITVHGDGGQTRDFIYVADICAALIAAMENTEPSCEVFNVCTGKETSILQLAETLKTISGNSAPVKFGDKRAGDVARSFGDNSKLVEYLGVTPAVSLPDGLGQTFKWLNAAFETA